jgi:hypothetical protein
LIKRWQSEQDKRYHFSPNSEPNCWVEETSVIWTLKNSANLEQTCAVIGFYTYPQLTSHCSNYWRTIIIGN